jgi:ABC-2 type transport system permease protein
MIAVARRDAAVLLSYQFALLVRVLQAAVFVVTLYFISRLVQRPAVLGPYQGRYFEFALVGAILVSFATLGLGSFSQAISEEQRVGTLEMLLGSPTRLAVVLAGAFVVPLALTGLEVVAYGTAGVLLGAHFSLPGVLLALPVLALTIATFCALGILSAGFIVLTKRGDPFALIGTQATTLLAGSLFPVAVFPGWLQPLSKAIPAYYGLHGIRAALLTGAGLRVVAGDAAVLAAFALALLPLSVIFFAWCVRVSRNAGTLGTY